MTSGNDLINAMDEMGDLVAVWTGLRRKFVDEGWSSEGAEQMTLEIMRHTPIVRPAV